MELFNLLLVEDNPGDAFLIQEMLDDNALATDSTHYSVETYGELAPALARLRSGDIDAVLLDLSLPDSHGLDTLRRALDEAKAPIVVLTGLDDHSLGVTAVQEGAQDYLVKGDVSGRLLTRALRYSVERYRIEQERKALIADLKAFAHTVAHDLKGPLTSLSFAGEFLTTAFRPEGEPLSTAEVEEYGELIGRKVKVMSNIIEELLLLASVRQQDVDAAPVDMSVTFENALQRLDHLIEEYGAEIMAPESWPMALGYGPWLEEVWANYLSNAVKYGGEPPLVKVGASSEQEGKVCYWVRDDGEGLSPAAQEQLFTPFTRLGQTRVTGHGLGLSIVQRIVEKLGGQVGVESRPGEGSTFSFTLPAVSG